MNKKITAIIPTFNRIEFLKKSLESVRVQTFKEIEILILDNCSQDGTEEYINKLKKLDDRILYFKNDKNIGSSANIRLGIEMVRTEFYSVLCDDNYLENDFYENAIKNFQKYPESGFVVFNTDIVDVQNKIIKKSMPLKNKIKEKEVKFYDTSIGFTAVLNDEIPMEWTGYVFRKKSFPEFDFGEFSEFGHGQDILMIWRFSSRYPFVLNNIKGATYVSHGNSLSAKIVKIFDERFLFWWRNRIIAILEDDGVGGYNRKILEKYFFTKSTKSLSALKYYTHSAALLILDRLKNKNYKDLKMDLIALRSFLPYTIIIIIIIILYPLVSLNLDEKLREVIRKIK
jgi:glycosyltransferase involved in cell wall biosynthesis